MSLKGKGEMRTYWLVGRETEQQQEDNRNNLEEMIQKKAVVGLDLIQGLGHNDMDTLEKNAP